MKSQIHRELPVMMSRSGVYRALWATAGSTDLASTRVRVTEVAGGLEEFGLKSKFVNGTGLSGRLRVLAAALTGRYDVIVVQKLSYERSMFWCLRKLSTTLVFECDDAIQLAEPRSGGRYSSESHVRKQRALLERVDVLTTTNDLLAEDFKPSSGRTVIYAGPAPPVRRSVKPGNFVLWLGSPSTSPQLDLLDGVPEDFKGSGIEFVAIGAETSKADMGWTVLDWSVETADLWLSRATVGLMPLSRSPWNDRKAGYKLLQYAAYGVVPVASDGPPARRLLKPDMDECLVPANGDWQGAIRNALDQADSYPSKLDSLVAESSVATVCAKWFLEVIEKGG